jgi:hypothetical protein
MVYGQVEKLLMKALLEPGFRKDIVALGKSACMCFACDKEEGEVLSALLANEGAGLAAVLSALEAAIDVRLSLGLYGKLPHELADGQLDQRGFVGHSAAMNAHAG